MDNQHRGTSGSNLFHVLHCCRFLKYPNARTNASYNEQDCPGNLSLEPDLLLVERPFEVILRDQLVVYQVLDRLRLQLGHGFGLRALHARFHEHVGIFERIHMDVHTSHTAQGDFAPQVRRRRVMNAGMTPWELGC